jgi:hypothetical protein
MVDEVDGDDVEEDDEEEEEEEEEDVSLWSVLTISNFP